MYKERYNSTHGKLYGGNQHLSFPRHTAPCQDGMQDRDEQVESIPGGFARPLLRKIIRPPQAATRRAQPCQSADRAYTGSGHTVLPHGQHGLGMDKAGIGITAEKVRDSLWTPKGIIGFHRMAFRTPECALPIQVQKTSVTVNDRVITLRNATMRIGKSDITATGSIHDLYGAMRHHKLLRAKLDVSSEQLDCNQLIRSISLPSDTLAAESDTVSTEVKLFRHPQEPGF